MVESSQQLPSSSGRNNGGNSQVADGIDQTTIEVANYIDTLEEGIDIYDKMVANYRLAMTVLLCSNLSFGIFAIFMVWKGFFLK